MKTYLDVAYELQNNSESFAVVTVVSSKGSAPQDPGAKAIITKSGLLWGTVGGGKVEAKAIQLCMDLLTVPTSPRAQLITWNLQRDIGMSCGGEITYLFELYQHTSWPIVIFGAGHVSQALIRVLKNTPCSITCVDSRIEWLDKLPQSAKIHKVLTADLSSYVEKLNENYYFVIMTQGHAVDLPILKEVYTRFPNAVYVGNIGSRIKGLKLRKELIEFGIPEQRLQNFNCPIGLQIGSNHPYEIAISVSAQLLQVRDQKLSSTLGNAAKSPESKISE